MSGKDLRETVGLLLVVASMLFVGLEVRQNAEATRAATVLQLKDGWAALNLTYIENPESAVMIQHVQDVGLVNADPESRLVAASMIRTLLHNWSNAYFQFRIGTLDDEQWIPLLRDMEGESDQRLTWDVWDNWAHIFDDPFRDLMDSLRVANYEPSP
jgi:hypothetical protein